tara:strand:- start:257 stop:1492 length:1236 start_codon:yes stop_codon:yes gene_type:complete
MKKLLSLNCEPENVQAISKNLEKVLVNNNWVQLHRRNEEKVIIPNHLLPEGPGLIIKSGGSSGEPNQCLIPCRNLDQSAIATKEWLDSQNITARESIIFNPLPISHVSGLMPWWRSRAWGAEHLWILPSLMRKPYELEEFCKSSVEYNQKPLIISLVPTQLERLLFNQSGLDFLRRFSLIWVGGGNLPDALALEARVKKIPISPCYGSTETVAMVTVLPPKEFLIGANDCGYPLKDVKLKVNCDGALSIKTKRLAKYIWNENCLENIIDKNGWWKSSDSAKLIIKGKITRLKILGRIDTAIISGGETIFPEKLEERILKEIIKNDIPVKHIIFSKRISSKWGEELVALIKLKNNLKDTSQEKIIIFLKNIVKSWPQHERPRSWQICNKLKPNKNQKWNRLKWKEWINSTKI